ncbi:MAG: error-prone DNA polymerase [SAR324 cluster bacterium]|nr:error-prone DNA polymerase [SAR324 cluster bacterium]
MEFSPNWTEWLCHSNFSFLSAAAHPEEMVRRAVELGYQGLGFCDYDGVYGIVRAFRERKKLQKDNPNIKLQLFYGAELHLTKDHDEPLLLQNTLVLYAQNHVGYKNLCSLLSAARKEGKSYPHMPLEELLLSDVTGIIAILPMRGLTRQGKHRQAFTQAEKIAGHFRSNDLQGNQRCYQAISRHLHPAEDCHLEAALKIAQVLDIPLLMSQDAYFDHANKKDLHDTLQAMKQNCTLDQAAPFLFPNDRRFLQTKKALGRLYGQLTFYQEALQNSIRLAQSFTFDLDQLAYHYPKEMIPEDFTPQGYLEHLVWTYAAEKYAGEKYGKVPEKVVKLLKHELDLVNQLNFADYFLTVWDIVAWARSQNIVCQGRGSAANSSICFVLGITAVNPNQFDLLFERFLSVERGDPPDIDVDFENARREEVIAYVYRRYGREKAAMVCNLITFRKKGAVREVGKALGVPEGILSKAANYLGSFGMRGLGLEGVFAKLQETELPEAKLAPHIWPLWQSMSARVAGYPRHLGIHSGGFMLSDKSINWLVPREPATMEGRTVIQWSKDDIEALGFFKIDLLALGMLTAMRKSFDLIKSHYGQDLSLNQIPEDDPATYDMIQKGETVGVFQIESAAQRASLPALRPKNFYDLVVQVAIIRPGPILAGVKHPYLRRRAGLEQVTYPDPRLEPILKRTYGTIIFQEQLMRVAMTVGGFTAGEADEIRKNIGSFSITGDIAKWTNKLYEGMKKEGLPEEFIHDVLKQIQGFASYGFPESHAASFALIAYASCWLKKHHPTPFFIGLLNSQPMGFYSPDSLIKTARREGVLFLPISVLKSEWDSTLESLVDDQGNQTFAIRLGFRLIKGVSHGGLEQMIERRQTKGGWKSLEEVAQNSGLSRKELGAIAAANTFLGLRQSRRSSLWRAEAHQPVIAEPAISYLPHYLEDEEQVTFTEETEIEGVQADYKATRLSLGRHLSQLIKEQAWVYPLPVNSVVTSAGLEKVRPNSIVTVFGMVVVRQSPGTAKKMLFITLEDESGSVQVVVSPPIFALYSELVEGQRFLCIQGRYQVNQGSVSILSQKVLSPEAPRGQVIPFELRRRFAQIQAQSLKRVRAYC